MNSDRRIKIRAGLIFILILFAYAGIVAKLYKVQIVEHEKYRLAALKRHNKPIKVKGERGNILDRNGEILAYSRNVVDFVVYAPQVDSLSQIKIAQRFSEVFGKKKEYYINLIQKKRGNVTLEKNVPFKKAVELAEFRANGLSQEKKYLRIYPLRQVASHVLGFINRENKAVSGVEKQYDEYLQGKDGYYLVERNAFGKIVAVDEERSVPPEKGDDVYLTLDVTFQKILENALLDGVNYFKGKSAIGIIEDPRTGEILAMANIPNFDPNNYNVFDAYSRKNRAITDVYEPGSTMKSVFMSILLNENKIRENEIINAENGSFVYKGRRIRDTHKFRTLKVREVLEYSSNIGMAKLSERIDARTLYKYLRNFGFGNRTGIDLPGEAKGELIKPNRFFATTKASISRGYAISVTPLQLTTAYSALVNGGELLRPFVVRKITDKNGTVLENEPEKIREVINEKTSSVIRSWMIDVVEGGTAKAARFDDVLIGGKTGTAMVLINGKYNANEYYASFVGYFPADAPKYVCYIWVERPQREKYGGSVAAPIFKRVVSELFEAYPEIVPEHKPINRNKQGYEKLYADLKKNRAKANVLTTADVNRKSVKKKEVKEINLSSMPDLIGKSKREAISILNTLGVKYKISGHGRIKSQSVRPGSKIKKGLTVQLSCAK